MRIGIIVPAFNAAPWIGEAIASVLAQTHRDWRLVVVDDGSTDGTSEVASRFPDPRIRLIRQANAGVSSARNAGMRALAADERPLSREAGEGWGGGMCAALLFLDADDWLAPDALARLGAALDWAPDAAAACGPYVFAGSRRVRTPPAGDILSRLLVGNLFANCGQVLLRWDAVQRAGGFLPGIAYGEDWEFLIRIALSGPFAAVRGRAPVLLVRQHNTGAYRRLAAEPMAFRPCMEAIFGNPVLRARFGAERLNRICNRTEAENAWVIGRELIRHGQQRKGAGWLWRSFRHAPSAKRAILLGASLLRLGPFALYAGTGRASFACNVPTSPCGRKMMNTTSSVP